MKNTLAITILILSATLTGCVQQCETRSEAKPVEYRPIGGWPTATPHIIRTPSHPELNATWNEMYKNKPITNPEAIQPRTQGRLPVAIRYEDK